MRKHLRPLAVLAAAAVGLAACSSSSSPSSSASSTTAPPATTAPASTTTGGASQTASGVPAVTNPTDLTKEPIPSAGTGPAPTTLIVKDLVVGTGATATAGSTVKVQYVGANYATGKIFDSSWSRGQPATFPLNGVIPGFGQAIVGMKVGGRREVIIPPNLAYGASPPSGSGIAPNETLIFIVDMLKIN